MIKLIQRHVAAFFATLAIAFPAAATTYSTDYTDLWWSGGSESGWGINLVQQGEVIFATMFVYANDNTAHWYSASALLPVGSSTTNFSGELTESRGPWLGNPTFDPNTVTRTTVVRLTWVRHGLSSPSGSLDFLHTTCGTPGRTPSISSGSSAASIRTRTVSSLASS